MTEILTSHDAHDRAARTATGLEAIGVHPGDRVCISATPSADVIGVVMGCLFTGVIPAIVSASATPRELQEMTSDIGAKAILHDQDISAVLAQEPTSLLERYPRCRPMHFTSGTSGRPKAVWSGWLSQGDAQAWIHEESEAWGISADDVHLVCGPLSHSAPLRFALITLLNGGSVIVPPAFDAAVASAHLTEATTTFMAPTHLQRIMEHHRDASVRHTLRLLAHAGAACPDHVRIWAHQTFGTDIVTEFYGSTEGQFTICTAVEWQEHPGTVGRAREGRELRVDEEGMLWCHVPEHARFSYWADPDKTRETWQGSWFTVRDLGHIDSDGYVYLHGRSGDLIITGGVNVYPAEIERVISNLAGISYAVAFGQSDDTWGEKVCLAVVGRRTEEDIRTYLAEQLSGPKRPKSIYVVDALPLTHSGKIDRPAVHKLFA
jgi:long-chain acyl-CoA synthetase